jgi:hypothetical protein
LARPEQDEGGAEDKQGRGRRGDAPAEPPEAEQEKFERHEARETVMVSI